MKYKTWNLHHISHWCIILLNLILEFWKLLYCYIKRTKRFYKRKFSSFEKQHVFIKTPKRLTVQ